MTLHINDIHVEDMAAQLQRLTGATTLTEVIGAAVQASLVHAQRETVMDKRFSQAFSVLDTFGPFPPSDHRKITDEIWGEL